MHHLPLNPGEQTVWRIPSGNLENCYLRQFRFSREDYDPKAVRNGSGWTLTRQQKPGRVAWPIPPSLLIALGSSVEYQPRMLWAITLLTHVCNGITILAIAGEYFQLLLLIPTEWVLNSHLEQPQMLQINKQNIPWRQRFSWRLLGWQTLLKQD